MRVTRALKRDVSPGLRILMTVGVAALLLTGCGHTVSGQAVSPLYDPFHVGGLPAVDGPSGIRDDAPAPQGTVLNSDDGPADRLAMLANNAVTEFWTQNYSPALQGSFTPIPRYLVDDDSPSLVIEQQADCFAGAYGRWVAEGNALTLTAGDIDEAVAGLLVNGVAASNVSGGTVPAGFTRIEAYRSGLQGDAELCYSRFP